MEKLIEKHENVPIVGVSSRQEIVLEDEGESNSQRGPAIEDYTKLIAPEELKGGLSEKRRYISDFAKFLSREDFIELGKMIKEEGSLELLKENSDGCRIDLSKVTSETLINKLFAAVKYKISQKK